MPQGEILLPLFFLFPRCRVEQSRKDKQYTDQGADGSFAEKVAKLREQAVSRYETEQKADGYHYDAGSKDGSRCLCQCFDDAFFRRKMRKTFVVAVTEQNGIIYGSAKLYGADDQVSNIKQWFVLQVRQ